MSSPAGAEGSRNPRPRSTCANSGANGGSKAVAPASFTRTSKSENDAFTSPGNSGSPRERQVKFAVGLPQVQWLTSSSATLQHQHSASYSSYSSDDDHNDGDCSYYSDDESSFTMSSYSTNTYGTDPSSSRDGGSCSYDDGWRGFSRSSNIRTNATTCSSSHRIYRQSRQQQQQRRRRQRRRRSSSRERSSRSNGGGKLKQWREAAAAAATAWDLPSLGTSDNVGLASSATPAGATNSTCHTDSISGSSSSTRIIRNIQRATLPTSRFMKKLVTDAVSSVHVHVAAPSSGEPATDGDGASDLTGSNIADDRNDRADCTTRKGNASVLNDSIREEEEEEGAPTHRAKSQPGVVSSILRKSKYGNVSSANVSVYDDDNYDTGAAVEQLKEDLSTLAGETAATFSLAVTNLGAGTDDFIDQACQMPISDAAEFSFSDDDDFICGDQHTCRSKRYVQTWPKYEKRRRRRKRRKSSENNTNGAKRKEGKIGGGDDNISQGQEEDIASDAPSGTIRAAIVSLSSDVDTKARNDEEKERAGPDILKQAATSSVLRSESSSKDDLDKSGKVPVADSNKAGAHATSTAEKVGGQSLGQSIMESASMGMFRSRSTPITTPSDAGFQPKKENAKEEDDANATADADATATSYTVEVQQPFPLLRSASLPPTRILNGTSSDRDQTQKTQGTLMLSNPNTERGRAGGDELLGSTLIVDSPSLLSFWQSKSQSNHHVSTDATVSTIGADSPAIIVASQREIRWLKNNKNRQPKLNSLSPRSQEHLRNGSIHGENRKRKYCAVACVLLVTTMIWIIVGALLWRKFSTTGSSNPSLGSSDKLEEDDAGGSALGLNGALSSQSSSSHPSQSPTGLPIYRPSSLSPTGVPSRAPIIPSPLPTVQPTDHPTKAKFTFDVALHSMTEEIQAECNPGLEARYEGALIDWIGQESYEFLDQFQVFDLAWRIEAAFDQDPSDEYFGRNGEYTDEVLYLHDKVRSFWELSGVEREPNESYTLRGVRGSILEEDEFSTSLAFVSLFDMSFQEAADAVQDVREVINNMPGGYDNALLSFHSLYYQLGPTTGTFMIGDGMLEYMDTYGRGDAPLGMALESSIAQLFGQYLLHSVLRFPVIDTAIPTNHHNIGMSDLKYQELLATALAGYYVAHPAGGSVSGDALCRQFFSLVRGKGTCNDNGRRLTASTQVECAAAWGARIVREDLVRILSPAEIHRQFEGAFPEIMANYWKVCAPLTEEECRMDARDVYIPDTAKEDSDNSLGVGTGESLSISSSSARNFSLVHHLFVLNGLAGAAAAAAAATWM